MAEYIEFERTIGKENSRSDHHPCRQGEWRMSDYISRETAIADLELYEKQVVKNEYALAIAGCRSHISKLPAADVRENKRGKWMEGVYGRVHLICSVCGYEWMTTHKTNYCPNCGADMRGSEGE